ncbi:hypothetical protein AB0M46_30135 [Dactylosporangium sp. NPDC051485]|uniref:hypothetical protein n=1 Tax=Dactylosporangium sp. NPDC051485 TaxID=3154846 RepID=UPI003435BEF8
MTAASGGPVAGDGSVGPLVVVTGWTAAGKSTLVDVLAGAGLRRVAGSAVLLPMLAEVVPDKVTRLRSWLCDPAAGLLRDGGTDRLADLAVLRSVTDRPGGVVVESAGSVPLLLSPYNDALVIRLAASAAVRADRVRRLLGGTVTRAEAARIVQRKDASTASACLAAWGLDLYDATHQRRYDLMLCCPDEDACTDPGQCVQAVTAVADAACRVCCCYLAADNGAATAAVAALTATVRQYQPWVTWICPTLTNAAEVSRQRWRDRLAYHTAPAELPRMGASC